MKDTFSADPKVLIILSDMLTVKSFYTYLDFMPIILIYYLTDKEMKYWQLLLIFVSFFILFELFFVRVFFMIS